MSVNLKSLIGKLNDTTRGALEEAATAVPGAHALRHRDRTFSAEAVGCERQRCGADSASVRRGCVAAAEGAGAGPGQAEERQRADAGVQPFPAEDADGGVDSGFAGFRSGRRFAAATRCWRCSPTTSWRASPATSAGSCRRSSRRLLKKDLPAITDGSEEDTEEAAAGESRAGAWLRRKPPAERRRIWISSP